MKEQELKQEESGAVAAVEIVEMSQDARRWRGDRRPSLPAGWGPPPHAGEERIHMPGSHQQAGTMADVGVKRSFTQNSLRGGIPRENYSVRSLPEGWVNSDTIRSHMSFRLATSPPHGGTIKTILSLPAGEDGFIRRQSSAVDLAPHVLISQWPSTAIAGNDILSSCLYSIGLVAQEAGVLAPLAFIAVSMVLYLYRGIYAMGVLTFPYNGGSYNLLANVAPKPAAAAGGCLSIVAYIATSVVSAISACSYLAEIVPVAPTLSASLLLVVFAMLVLYGLKESTRVALSIFIAHATTLVLLAVGTLALACADGFTTLQDNIREPMPKSTGNVVSGFAMAIFLGFSTAMLGVSGFESSAQFVESMQEGVFVKTLRNLWASVTVVNPLLSFLAVSVLPMEEVLHNRDTVLAHMARKFGHWAFGGNKIAVQALVTWMAFDAFIVLSGAVLTAFVGVDGLIYQLAADNCMPAFLLKKNRWRKTNHYIILVFLGLSLLLVLTMNGAVDSLAGVYSISFLSVMACFGVGAALLKATPLYAPVLKCEKLMLSWTHITTAVLTVLLALVGNLMNQQGSLISFIAYLTPTYTICLLCIYSNLWLPRLKRMCTHGARKATHTHTDTSEGEISKEDDEYIKTDVVGPRGSGVPENNGTVALSSTCASESESARESQESVKDVIGSEGV